MEQRAVPAAVEETRYRGETAIRLRTGTLSAAFLPGLGLTGVSLRHAGGEFLAVPGGLDALRVGSTSGFPLVGPWVNRLSGTTYRVGSTTVDVGEAMAAGRVRPDGNGLPIHGFLSGRSQWTVDVTSVRGDLARFVASTEVDDPAFPFPHRVEVRVSARPDGLDVDTTVVPTGRRGVPLAFGWHPYLRIPGTPRARWRLRTPTWDHLALDAFGIPTGESSAEAATDEPIGRRRFDDLYALRGAARGSGRAAGRQLGFAGEDGRSFTLRCGAGYTHAQVWVPAGKAFASLEPMAAPTNALVEGTAPIVERGESATVTFAVDLTAPA